MADVRPITGHLQMNTTAIYNKMSREKAITAARLGQQYVRALNQTLAQKFDDAANQR